MRAIIIDYGYDVRNASLISRGNVTRERLELSWKLHMPDGRAFNAFRRRFASFAVCFIGRVAGTMPSRISDT